MLQIEKVFYEIKLHDNAIWLHATQPDWETLLLIATDDKIHKWID